MSVAGALGLRAIEERGVVAKDAEGIAMRPLLLASNKRVSRPIEEACPWHPAQLTEYAFNRQTNRPTLGML